MAVALPIPSALDLLFIVLVLAAMHGARRWIPLYALLVLPGTALHETAHWLVGGLLGAQPEGLRLLPRRLPDRRWRLGSVGFRRLRWFSAVPVALAPLLLLPLAWWAYLLAAAQPEAHWQHWVGLYVATAAAASSLPSRADWALALSRPLGAVLYLLVLPGALFAYAFLG